MRVLILGANGMLGHKLWQRLSPRLDAYATVRHAPRAYARHGIFDPDRLIGGVDAFQFDSITKAVAQCRPDVVVNSVGIIKQQATSYDPVHALTINSILPHKLKNLCALTGARLIQFSTDCVFSGKAGNYAEDDESDATDLYGRSKFLGEVSGPGCLTLRTSIIGRELASSYGLVDWFLSNQGKAVGGYTRAIFSGFPTLHLADLVGDIIERHPGLEGVWHVSSDPIAKHDLVLLVRDAYGADIEVRPDPSFAVDRSLDSTRFRQATGFAPRPWPEMVAEMAADPTPYPAWK